MSMRKIYRKVAKKNGVSISTVKREIKTAINYAYSKPDKNQSETSVQQSVESRGKIPTSDEMILHFAKKIKQQA